MCAEGFCISIYLHVSRTVSTLRSGDIAPNSLESLDLIDVEAISDIHRRRGTTCRYRLDRLGSV